MIEILLAIFYILIENICFCLPIQYIKKYKTKRQLLILFFGMLFINLSFSYILSYHIFKYILILVFIYFLLKLLDVKNTKIYDAAIHLSSMLLKTSIEFLFIITLLGIIDIKILIILFQVVSLGIFILIKKPLLLLYNRLQKYWDSGTAFYHRYIVLLIYISTIILILYNMMQFKEV